MNKTDIICYWYIFSKLITQESFSDRIAPHERDRMKPKKAVEIQWDGSVHKTTSHTKLIPWIHVRKYDNVLGTCKPSTPIWDEKQRQENLYEHHELASQEYSVWSQETFSLSKVEEEKSLPKDVLWPPQVHNGSHTYTHAHRLWWIFLCQLEYIWN